MRDDKSKSILFPVAGILSVLIGFFIANSGLSVHSGELFLFLFGAIGLMMIFPLLMLTKSIQLLRKKSFEKETTRKTSLILTVSLGVVLVSMFILAVWLE